MDEVEPSKSVIMDLFNGPVEIDRDLAPLIKALNDVGLRTTNCCSGHGKQDAYVQIAFDHIIDVALRHGAYEEPRLTIWWHFKGEEDLRPNHQEVSHTASKASLFKTIADLRAQIKELEEKRSPEVI